MAESSSSATCKKKLDGKVAIVTGGASGIGEATARLFANHGVRAVVIADIQDELGQNLAKSIGLHKCTYIHCDVTDEAQVKSMVDQTVQIYGQLDIMFSNAGIISDFNQTNQTVLDLDFSAFDRLFAINTRGMAACVKHASRVMVEGRVRGSIVCTTSTAASHGTVRCTDYCMSKHAVLGLVRSASMQLGVHGIRVNSVSPYVVATPMMCHALQMEVKDVEKFYEADPTLKGVVLKAEDVANAVLFLVSNDSAFVTGHDLIVDGGYLNR